MASPRLVTGANRRARRRRRRFDLDRLAGERAPVRVPASGTRSAVSRPCVRAAELAAGVAEPDQRLTAEVGDEKGDRVGAERVREAASRTSAAATGGASSTAASSCARSNRTWGSLAAAAGSASLDDGRSTARSGVLLDIGPAPFSRLPPMGLSRSGEEGDG